MLKITMLRHGKTEGNSKGRFIGVTDESLLEEEKIALSELKFPKADAVYCSPMKRCIETAQILYPYERAMVIPELAERDFGLFEGKTYKELTEDTEYKDWVKKGEIVSFPEGEDRSEFQERCISAFERVVEDAYKNESSEIAVIAHGGTIMSVLYAYGFPHQEYMCWIVGNGEGYRLRLSPEEFLNETARDKRKIIVDGKIVRPEQ